VKDALERKLHNLVCAGELDLKTAQREIASNWIEAYKKYVKLLRIGDSLPAPHFEIISSPNEYLDTVKKDQGTPSALGALYLEFCVPRLLY
jgi:hypothetical protein